MVFILREVNMHGSVSAGADNQLLSFLASILLQA